MVTNFLRSQVRAMDLSSPSSRQTSTKGWSGQGVRERDGAVAVRRMMAPRTCLKNGC
jgi:hypothetical protein